MKTRIASPLTVLALSVIVIGLTGLMSQPTRAAGPWYVAPGGSDSHTCLSPAGACATINAALNKPGFAAGDTIRIAVGTYTGDGGEVVLLNKHAALSGGWNAAFTSRIGLSILDGQGMRSVIRVASGMTATLDRLQMRNGDGGLGGGGGLANYGTLTVTQASVISNTAGNGLLGDTGGGGILNAGKLVLNNSAINGNRLNGAFWGSGIFNSGTLILNNTTVSDNSNGEGVFNKRNGTIALNSSTLYQSNRPAIVSESVVTGSVSLRNTIVAGNTAASAYSDCTGILASAGYNLVGKVANCTVISTTGDLLNVDPRLFALVGSPAYRPLFSTSPAIDAGHPAGCVDHLGNLLNTDQRGMPRVGRCDIGAYEFDPDSPIRQVYLPAVLRTGGGGSDCPSFFDDFSSSSTGWPVGEDALFRTEYLNGEYHVVLKGSSQAVIRSPSCSRDKYVVEADARWVGETGDSYGIAFGLTGGSNPYYLFYVSSDVQWYALFRCDPSDCAFLTPGFQYASAIHAGTATNHLKVTRSGISITLEINNTVLGTWSDNQIAGLTGAGLYVGPDVLESPPWDARFDNFSTVSLSGN